MFLEYGVNESNRYIHISQVNSGRVPLACPYCGQSLIARKGTQKEHHFAHDDNTCRESDRDFKALNIPYFDRFDTYIDKISWGHLQDFHTKGYTNFPQRLIDHELLRLNTWGRRRGSSYELTDLGKIPFGLATLSKFSELQTDKIMERHYNLSETIRLAHFGETYPGNPNRYHIAPIPDMVLSGLADLNIYRSQVARVFNLDLYLLQIRVNNRDDLYKIGVTSDIDRRVSEVQRDLSKHMEVKNIEILRHLKNRGAIERYALHRYKDNNYPIDTLTEYFVFDKSTRRNVLSDFTRLGDYKLATDDSRYLPTYYEDEPQRYTQRGLITSILEGQPALIEVTLKDIILRDAISKGTIEGMQRAKEAGIHIGRPNEDNQAVLDKYPNVIECINKGMSLRMTATECNVSVNTVRKVKSILNSLSKGINERFFND